MDRMAMKDVAYVGKWKQVIVIGLDNIKVTFPSEFQAFRHVHKI
jgi:hypothetical protein